MNQTPSAEDLWLGMLPVEYLILDLDFAMWAHLWFDGQKSKTTICLQRDCEQPLEELISRFVDERGEELVAWYWKCEKCGAPFIYRHGASVPEQCPRDRIAQPSAGGNTSNVRRDICGGRLRKDRPLRDDADYLRQEAGFALARSPTRPIESRVWNVSCWLSCEIYPGQVSPHEITLTRDELLGHLRNMMAKEVDKIFFVFKYLGDPMQLKGRRDLIPKGETLAAKHSDYRSLRDGLIVGFTWLSGFARDNDEFIESGYAPTSPRVFPPPVPLPGSALTISTNELPSSADEAVARLGSDWATTRQLATLLGTTESAIRGKIRRARKSKGWMPTLNERVLEYAGPLSAKMEFRVLALWPFLSRSRARAQE